MYCVLFDPFYEFPDIQNTWLFLKLWLHTQFFTGNCNAIARKIYFDQLKWSFSSSPTSLLQNYSRVIWSSLSIHLSWRVATVLESRESQGKWKIIEMVREKSGNFDSFNLMISVSAEMLCQEVIMGNFLRLGRSQGKMEVKKVATLILNWGGGSKTKRSREMSEKWQTAIVIAFCAFQRKSNHVICTVLTVTSIRDLFMFQFKLPKMFPRAIFMIIAY